MEVWQVQAIGALYLLFMAINHIVRKLAIKGKLDSEQKEKPERKVGFWVTVFKVELADIAFAVDSILSSSCTCSRSARYSTTNIGGLDGGKFLVIFAGGIIGLYYAFCSKSFVKLLERRPGLEIAAFAIVGWVGVKLAVYTLSHPALPY